jgi:hypothetical protein
LSSPQAFHVVPAQAGVSRGNVKRQAQRLSDKPVVTESRLAARACRDEHVKAETKPKRKTSGSFLPEAF